MSEKATNGTGDHRRREGNAAGAERAGEGLTAHGSADNGEMTPAGPELATEAGESFEPSDAAAGALVEAEAGEVAAEPTAAERIAALEERIAALEQESKQNYDRFLRASADLDNFRKRARRDLEDARFEARIQVLKDMLPVIDNLERALTHAEGSAADGAGIVDGVKLVLRQFSQALERGDVHALDALGKPFDPAIHEAISQVETAEHAPGTVIQVLQRGYKLGQRLLRPALCVVAKAPAEREVSNPGNGAGGTSATSGGNDREDSTGGV